MNSQQQILDDSASEDADYSFRSTNQEYVNIRKRRGRSLSQDLSTTQISFDSRHSLPDLSMRGRDLEIESLKSEIRELRENLESANNEVDNLSIEVMSLKSIIQKMDKKTERYKHMYVQSMTSSKKKMFNKKAREYNDADEENSLDITYKELKITKPIQQHDSTKSEKENCPNKPEKTIIMSESSQPNPATPETKRKIMIISSNKRNKIIQMAEHTFECFDVCHYLTPNVGIQILLKDLNKKLETFAHRDYCVVFIGEEDFRNSNDYKELVTSIRETLANLSHTNIILCLPTFKCGKSTNIYNKRIETFNSYLYEDTQRHEYAYLLDANLNLTYDWSMFSGRWGILNNRGMRTIMTDLDLFIMDLELYHSSICNTHNTTSQPHKSTYEDKLQINDPEKQSEFFLL